MTNLDDTQPNPVIYAQDEIPAPPRILLWGILGLFVLGIFGTAFGVYAFRDVLRPSQQQRVIGYLPFMDSFLRRGEDLPTAPAVDQQALNSLLTSPLTLGTPTANPDNAIILEATEDALEVIEATPETVEATEEAVVTEEVVVAEVATEILSTPIPQPTATEQVAEVVPTQQTANTSPVAQSNVSTRPSSQILGGITWEQQSWNNCGPANITMALSYYGWTRNQDFAENILRPETEDKNVRPDEMVAFVNEQTDLNAIYRYGGDIDMLRDLLANGFPVIIEAGSTPEGNAWLGHYQTVAGYDDGQQAFFAYDSFIGATTSDGIVVETYSDLDANWQDFNRLFIVIYEPSRESLVMDLLGVRADPLQAAEHAFNVAQSEALANPRDPYAYFNMGVSLAQLDRYDEAQTAFDYANRLGFHYRMLWYQFDLFETYLNVGRIDDVLAYVGSNLTNGGQWVEETYYWQGRALAAQGNTAAASTAFRTALNRNPNFTDAQIALDELS
ncbi:MAG: C39 family peptidase [Aggregatilineales bacterium]